MACVGRPSVTIQRPCAGAALYKGQIGAACLPYIWFQESSFCPVFDCRPIPIGKLSEGLVTQDHPVRILPLLALLRELLEYVGNNLHSFSMSILPFGTFKPNILLVT